MSRILGEMLRLDKALSDSKLERYFARWHRSVFATL